MGPSEYVKMFLLLRQCRLTNVSVLVLLVWIGVGVRVLGEVKGEHFADDTITLLQEEEGRKKKKKHD